MCNSILYIKGPHKDKLALQLWERKRKWEQETEQEKKAGKEKKERVMVIGQSGFKETF